MPTTYPAEFKVKTIRRYEKGESIKTLSQELHISQSTLSASAKPLVNAVAETFFATFKREETYRKDYTSEQHVRRSVEEYIRFYNEVRPHQTLNYKTPQAFENAYRGVLSESGV